MADVKDIFTKKDLAEVEAKREKDKEDKEEYVKEIFHSLLEGFKDHVDSGNITGLVIAATTDTGIIVPQCVTSSTEASIKMNFVADLFKDIIKEDCADAHGLVQYEEYE